MNRIKIRAIFVAGIGRIMAVAVAMCTSAAVAKERRATIFYTGSVGGTLEPCGCTSDPLGDIARMTGLVRRAAQEPGGGVLVVDAGNLSFPLGVLPPRKKEALQMRAAFLAGELGKLPFAGAALGEADLAAGVAKVLPPRLAANAIGAPCVKPGRVHHVGGIAVGVLGLSDPEILRAQGWKAEDPVVAAEKEAKRLRQDGAEIIVALAAFDRAAARRVARTGAVDFIVVGQNVGEGLNRADHVGSTFIVAAADELRRVGRLDVVLRDDQPGRRQELTDGGGTEAHALERAEIEARLKVLNLELVRWETQAGADPGFVGGKRRERDDLAARLKVLNANAWKPPTGGSYFTNQLIPLKRALARDPVLAAAMKRLDREMGAASLRAAVAPPKGEPGRAVFVGDRKCIGCHKGAAKVWNATVHAHAWKTLVDDGKTLQEDCVSCHVTGFGEIGGSSLGFVKGLTNVQCETCHGPGSVHVASEGLEDPASVHRNTPESTCVRCHNDKHSDTFNFAAYLRDILGPGHGDGVRRKLGAGPSGKGLRDAAKAKAKAKAAGAALVKQM